MPQNHTTNDEQATYAVGCRIHTRPCTRHCGAADCTAPAAAPAAGSYAAHPMRPAAPPRAPLDYYLEQLSAAVQCVKDEQGPSALALAADEALTAVRAALDAAAAQLHAARQQVADTVDAWEADVSATCKDVDGVDIRFFALKRIELGLAPAAVPSPFFLPGDPAVNPFGPR